MKKIALIIGIALLSCNAFAQIITTVAGMGPASGYSGDNGPATAAKLNTPLATKVDFHGNVFFSDYNNNVVRKIEAGGIITTIAGNSTAGYSGDGSAATAAMLNHPNNLAFDKHGNLFVADESNNVIRKVDTLGIITTVAGNNVAGYNGDNIPATAAMLNQPTGVAFDSLGNLYIADVQNARVRMVATSGIITTIAGTGVLGFGGDNGPATAAMIDGIITLNFNNIGELYAVDQSNYRVRKISGGIITTVAGNGSSGYSGDSGPATAAGLFPTTTAFDKSGNLVICDAFNNRIRIVNNTGIISTIAGNATNGYFGDGGPATAAELNIPSGVTFDVCNNLYFCDQGNNVIRKITYFTGMPAISGPMTVGTGWSINLSISIDGGTWSSGSPSVATVDSSTGVVTGITVGPAVISFTNMCGTATYTVSVHSSVSVPDLNKSNTILVIPNPSNGEITVNGNLPELAIFENVTINIIGMTGIKVYSDVLPVNNGTINSRINLNNNIPNGIYIIELRGNQLVKEIRFSLYR